MSALEAILADPVAAMDLPTGAIVTHIIVIAEYVNPGSDNRPDLPRICVDTDDSMSIQGTLGMLDFARLLEEHQFNPDRDTDDDT